MASKALNNTANDSKQQITAISDLKPKHTTKMVHVKVLHSWSQNINHGGETMEFVLADENVSNPNFFNRIEFFIKKIV